MNKHKKGDLVIVIAGAGHNPEAMDKYVGMKAVVQDYNTTNIWLDVDGGRFTWDANTCMAWEKPKKGATIVIRRAGLPLELLEFAGRVGTILEEGPLGAVLSVDKAKHFWDFKELDPWVWSVGDEVVLCRHERSNERDEESENFDDEMLAFVGKRTKITEILHEDQWKCMQCNVEGNDWNWRLDSLRLASEVPMAEAAKVLTYVKGERVVLRPMPQDTDGWLPDVMNKVVGVGTTISDVRGDAVRLVACRNGYWYMKAWLGLPTIEAGDSAILGRHVSKNGTDSWSARMADYEGANTIVDEIMTTPDGGGCEVARVEIDRHKHFWRTENMTLLKKGGLKRYAYKVGERIKIVSAHENGEEWQAEQANFIGLPAEIVSLPGKDQYGKAYCILDIDEGRHVWRLENLTPLKGEGPKITPKDKEFELSTETKFDKLSVTNKRQLDGAVLLTLENKQIGGRVAIKYEAADLARFFRGVAKIMVPPPKEAPKVEAKEEDKIEVKVPEVAAVEVPKVEAKKVKARSKKPKDASVEELAAELAPEANT